MNVEVKVKVSLDKGFWGVRCESSFATHSHPFSWAVPVPVSKNDDIYIGIVLFFFEQFDIGFSSLHCLLYRVPARQGYRKARRG